MLSSEGAERRGAHPLGTPCDDAPPCRAGHGSPWGAGAPQGQFLRDAVPWGAGMCPLSGGVAPDPLHPAGAGCGTLCRGVGALRRECRKPQCVLDPRQRLRALELSHQARSEACGKVLRCGVKWRLSCRGAGERSSGGIPGIIQAPRRAFLSVKTL